MQHRTRRGARASDVALLWTGGAVDARPVCIHDFNAQSRTVTAQSRCTDCACTVHPRATGRGALVVLPPCTAWSAASKPRIPASINRYKFIVSISVRRIFMCARKVEMKVLALACACQACMYCMCAWVGVDELAQALVPWPVQQSGAWKHARPNVGVSRLRVAVVTLFWVIGATPVTGNTIRAPSQLVHVLAQA